MLRKYIRLIALYINATFPFVYQHRYMFHNLNVVRSWYRYCQDYKEYINKGGNLGRFPISFVETFPCIYDRYAGAGKLARHYFFQDQWASRKVYQSAIDTHYDIGSRLDGFIAHCLVFCTVIMLDIRPLSNNIPNLRFKQADAMNMGDIPSCSIHSISSLHAFEHFGLGRYNDTVDPDGYMKAIKELKRIISKKGNLYFSVPIGKQRLIFNAHRIFDPLYIIDLFSDFELVEFSVVDEANNLVINALPSHYVNSNYVCGLFHFRKDA